MIVVRRTPDQLLLTFHTFLYASVVLHLRTVFRLGVAFLLRFSTKTVFSLFLFPFQKWIILPCVIVWLTFIIQFPSLFYTFPPLFFKFWPIKLCLIIWMGNFSVISLPALRTNSGHLLNPNVGFHAPKSFYPLLLILCSQHKAVRADSSSLPAQIIYSHAKSAQIKTEMALRARTFTTSWIRVDFFVFVANFSAVAKNLRWPSWQISWSPP